MHAQQKVQLVSEKKYRDTLPEGYSLHWYELQSVLGRGGYGITYLAMDKNLERQAAIKEYLPLDFAARQGDQTVSALSSDHEDMFHWGLERFLKEARTLAKFNHPNIVRVISVFEHNNTAYMVMEYEQGKDLSYVYKSKELFSEEELLDIFIPVIDGLGLVHQEGFIHRDIKPSNIYIRDDQSPVLLDFGSARQSAGQTRTLTSLVTYGYAPFEQYNEGQEKQGPWTDIYALGASLYFGITKTKPEDALKRGGCILAGTPDPYQPVSVTLKGKYQDNFLLAIDNALRFRADDRPQDVLSWAEMLLGKTNAPALPEVAINQANNLDQTIIMPLDYYDKPQTGEPSKPNTGRLIDASGRRVTSAQPGAIPVDVDSENANALSGTPSQRIPATEPFSEPAPDAVSQRPGGQKRKSLNTPILALAGLIVTLVVLAFVILVLPEKDSEQAQTEDNTAKIEKQAEEIASLLSQAQHDFTQGRLVQPAANNAAYRYNKVLELDPKNKEAAQGINKIIQSLASIVEEHVKQGETLKADIQLRVIESISPRSPIATQLRSQVNAAKDTTGNITVLLKDAKRDFKARRLTDPKGDNALEKYERVLQLDPNNKEAKKGKRNIFQYYVSAAEKHAAAGNAAKVEAIIGKMNLIQRNSAEAQRLTKKLAKIESQQNKIATLLDRAKFALDTRHYIEPTSKNAYYFYKQVLQLDPKNRQANKGIKKIQNHYQSEFDKFYAESNYPEAEQAVKALKVVASDSVIANVNKKLQSIKPPDRPGIEVTGELMGDFKKAIESYNLRKLKGMSEFQPGREQFVEQFFDNYQSVKVNISGYKYIARENKALANITLSRLINNKGHAVSPGAWGEFEITVKRNSKNQWRVYW